MTLAGSALTAGAATAQDAKSLEKRVKALEKAGGQSVTRSKKSMSLTLSGHINRAVQLRDNGTESGILHVTNEVSRTRVRWIGEGKINDDLIAGINIELGNKSAASSSQDLGDNGDDNGPNAGGGGQDFALDERHIEFQIMAGFHDEFFQVHAIITKS